MNSKKIKNSILILTKNRAKLLEKNLQSLLKQIHKPDEIIIINNNSTDKTKTIIKKYKQKLPIKFFTTKLSGYPRLYNLGIKKSKGTLICFLDDDCIADKNWLYNLLKSRQKYPSAVIQGKTFTLPKNNFYAQIMGEHYQNWLKSNLINKNGLKSLDNKNCAISKTILNKYGGFSKKYSLGSEDIELAIRLRKNNIKIIYQSKAIAWHHERTTFTEFIKQHYRIAKSEAFLDKNSPKKEKIGIFPKKKSKLIVKSFAKKSRQYLKKGQILAFFRFLLIYLILFHIRLSGYLSAKKK